MLLWDSVVVSYFVTTIQLWLMQVVSCSIFMAPSCNNRTFETDKRHKDAKSSNSCKIVRKYEARPMIIFVVQMIAI